MRFHMHLGLASVPAEAAAKCYQETEDLPAKKGKLLAFGESPPGARSPEALLECYTEAQFPLPEVPEEVKE